MTVHYNTEQMLGDVLKINFSGNFGIFIGIGLVVLSRLISGKENQPGSNTACIGAFHPTTQLQELEAFDSCHANLIKI